MSLDISVIIPCLNEHETIAIVVDKALVALHKLNLKGEVIVADNWSTDGSEKIAEQHGAKVIHVPYKGYGNALKAGFDVAKGKLLLMGDADDSYDFNDIYLFLEAYNNHTSVDVVMGNRLATVIPGAMPFLHRYLGTPVLTWIINLFFKTHISDCNCGMRLITRKAYDILSMQSEGMEFASEMIIKAWLHKMNIVEININLYPDGRKSRKPHLNTWRDGRRHLKYILLLSPRWTLQIPGLLFSVIGMILMFSQIAWPLKIGEYNIDIHFMILGLTLTLIGHLICIMGLIIEPFARVEGLIVRSSFFDILSSFSLEKYIIGGLSVLGVWLIIDFSILYDWIWQFTTWNPVIEVRKSIIAAYFIFMWLLIVFGWFVWKMIIPKGEEHTFD